MLAGRVATAVAASAVPGKTRPAASRIAIFSEVIIACSLAAHATYRLCRKKGGQGQGG
jgi:hypothetical protein